MNNQCFMKEMLNGKAKTFLRLESCWKREGRKQFSKPDTNSGMEGYNIGNCNGGIILVWMVNKGSWYFYFFDLN